MNDDNRCVICGMVIPEGRMLCPICEAKTGGHNACGTNKNKGDNQNGQFNK